MNGIDQLSSAVCTRIVLTFAHFLWQGVAIAILGQALAWAAARHSARLRYGIYVISLSIMVLAVLVTYGLLDLPLVPKPLVLGPEPPQIVNDSLAVDHTRAQIQTEPVNTASIVEAADPAPIRPEKPQEVIHMEDLPRSFDWHQCVPYAMGLYYLGTLVLLLRLLLGLGGAQRLRRLACPVDDPGILAILQQQSQCIGLATVPAIALCKQVMVPTVVGVIKPMILLPLAFASELSPQQIEMLIVHELAHIRRYDPLVNVLQRVVEALLFFHPAVWFISYRIRIERENCCDDIVLRTGAKATDYASSLLDMAQQTLLAASSQRLTPTDLNATGRTSRIGNRIRRLTGSPARHQIRLRRTWLIVLMLSVMAVFASSRLESGIDTDNAQQLFEEAKQDQKLWPDISLRLLDENGLLLADMPFELSLCIENSEQGITENGRSAKSTNTTWIGTETYHSDEQGVLVLASDKLFKSARLARMALGVLIVHRGKEIGVFHRVVVPQRDSLETVVLSLIPLCHVRGTLYSSELMGRGFSLDSISIMFWEPSIFPLWHRSADTSFDLLLPPGKYHLRMSGATKYVGGTEAISKRIVVEPGQSRMDIEAGDLPADDFVGLIDRPAPELRTIQPWLNGPPIELADLKGKLVLLHLASSVRELDQLVKLHNQYSEKGLAIIAIFNHIGNKTLFEQQLFEESRQTPAQIPFHMALDEPAETTVNGKRTPGATHIIYLTENPINVLINRQGRIVGKLGWSLRASQKVEEFIEDLLTNEVDEVMGLPRPVLSSEFPEGFTGPLTKCSFADVDLRVALKGLSSETDIPIIAGPGVNGVISADLPRLPLEIVLDVLCAANDCVWKKTPSYYIIERCTEEAIGFPYRGPLAKQFYDNEDLLAALNALAAEADTTIIPGAGVGGIISADLPELPLEIVLDILCAVNNCIWKKTEFYYLVVSCSDYSELLSALGGPQVRQFSDNKDSPDSDWSSESLTTRGGPLVSQSFDDEDLLVALQRLASEAGVTIIPGPEVAGIVSTHIPELPLEIALDIICIGNQCSWKKTQHYYLVSHRAAKTLKLPYPVWSSNACKGKHQGPVIDLIAERDSLQRVVKTISIENEVSVIVDPAATGELTMEFVELPLEEVLDIICEETGNVWYKTPHYYFISPAVGGTEIISHSRTAQEVTQDDDIAAGGGLVIQPMEFAHTTRAGNKSVTKIRLDNQFGHRVHARVESIDLVQDGAGTWTPVKLDAPQMESAKNRSCRKWISLSQAESGLIEIEPAETHALELQVGVPSDARGRYTAGILLTLLPAPEAQLRTQFQYIVPVRLLVEDKLAPGAGVPPVAQFAVHPMKYAFESRPGKAIETKLYIQSLRPHINDSVSLEVIDLHRAKYRHWFTDASNEPNPNTIGLLDKEPCQNWISLGEYQEDFAGTEPAQLCPVDLKIKVPPRTQGSFGAGVLVCFHGGRNKRGVSVKYEFVVPICLEVSETAVATSITQSQELQAIVTQKKTLKVSQGTSTIDPFRTYGGGSPIAVYTDLPVNLKISAKASSPAGGNWAASVAPDSVFGKTKGRVSLKVDGIRLEKLASLKKDFVVVDVAVTLIPYCRSEPARQEEDLSAAAPRQNQDQPKNAREIALSCVKALRAIEHPRSGVGSAVVQGSHNSKTRKHLVRFKFKEELSRSDILAGLSGAREYVRARGCKASAIFYCKESRAYVGKLDGIYYGIHGSDFRPRTFESCLSKMSIADELEHLAQRTDLPLTVSTDDNGLIGLSFANKHLFVLDRTKGHRIVEYRWDCVIPGEASGQDSDLLYKRMQISWKRYGTSWYIDRVDYSGFPSESGNPISIQIMDFVPNIDLDDREFTIEAFDLPLGTKVKDSIKDLEYDWDSAMSRQEAVQGGDTTASSGLEIQPKVFVRTARPGNKAVTRISLHNQSGHRMRLTAERTELVQDDDGHWIPIEPNATQTVSGMNQSCRKWISLGQNESGPIEIDPRKTATLKLDIQIPPDAKGAYYAGVALTLLSAPGDQVRSEYEHIVPVMLEIGKIGTTPGHDAPPAAHFAVYPMMHSLQAKPGKSIATKLYLQNLRPHAHDNITLEVINLRNPDFRSWFVNESNASDPNHAGLLVKQPCHNWITLGQPQESIAETESAQLRPVDLEINVPAQTQGSFSAGILVSFRSGGNETIIAVKYEFVVPICLEVGETIDSEAAIDFSQFNATVKQSASFKVAQDKSANDPIHSYRGAMRIEFHADLPASLKTSAQASGPAGGNWRSTVAPRTILEQTEATVALDGNDVRLERLFGPEETIRVAEISLTVIPHCKYESAEKMHRPVSTKPWEDGPDIEFQDATAPTEPEPGTIQGRVVLSDGSPCVEQDYVVEIKGPGPRQKVLCEIDAQGRFAGTGLFVGHYVVSVRDFLARHRLLCAPVEIELSPQNPSEELLFTLGHEVPVKILTLKADDSKPVPQARVTVESLRSTVRLTQATDSNGCCEFSLIPGQYRIRVAQHDPFFVDWMHVSQAGEHNPESFLVAATDESLSMRLLVSPLPESPQKEIKGVLLDTKGRRVKGLVDLSRAVPKPVQERMSGHTFAIPLPRHAPDQARGYAYDVSGRLGLRFTWPSGSSTDNMPLVLKTRARITGQVVDIHGQGVSDTDLRLVTPCPDGFSWVEDPSTYTLSTDDDGHFQFECMVGDPPLRVRASWEGLHAQSDLLDLRAGKTADVGKLVLRKLKEDKSGIVRGRITNEQGHGLMDCPVSIKHRGQTRTDSQGHFTLKGFPDDLPLTVTAEIPGYGARSRTTKAGDLNCNIQACPPAWGILGKEAPPLCIDKRFDRVPLVRLKELRGKVVLLQFRPEDADRDLPIVRELYREYGFRGLTVISIVDPTHISKFNPYDSNIPFPWYIDDNPAAFGELIPEAQRFGGATHSLYHAHNPSTYILIDRQGIVRVSPAEDELEIWIQRLLAEDGNPANADNQSAFLDAETVFDIWESRYGHINSLKYRVTEKLVSAEGSGTENRTKLLHLEMIMDGENGLLQWTCDSAGLENVKTVTVESFDGNVGKSYELDPPHGRVYSNRGRVRDRLKAQLCLKYILGANTKEKGKVWAQLERVAGQPCHVVEIDDPENERNIKFWFAHAKGMVLLKHELTMVSGEHKHYWQMEAQTLGSSLTDAGMFWYPGVLVRKESLDDQRITEYKVEIHEFVPHIKVSADTFDFQFPKGTPVEDQVTSTYYVEGDTNTPRRQIGRGEFYDIAFPARSEAVSSPSQETNRAETKEGSGAKIPMPTHSHEASPEDNESDEKEPVVRRILDSVSPTGNGISGWLVDEGYRPITDVLVKARPLKSLGIRQALELEARSDSKGRFVFPKTIVGEEYLLEFFAPGFEYKTETHSPDLFAEKTVVLRAQPRHHLSGQVLHAKTQQGAAHAQVVLIGEKVYQKTLTCDQDGYYRFDDVPHNIGQGVIYAKLQEARSEYRMIRNNSGYVDLTLDVPCQIKGVVSDSQTGKPIANCTVQAKPEFMSGFAIETHTDDDGAYVLNNIPRGEYLVWVRHAEWFQPPNRGDFLEPPEIRTLPGKAVSRNVGMIEKATVTGKVLGPDRLPVVGASVCVKSAQGPNYTNFYSSTKTGEAGDFELRTGALGSIGHGAVAVISAVADGLGTGSVTLNDLKAGEVRNGMRNEALIQLSGVMSVSGHVKDPKGNPIPGVYVYVQRHQWPFFRTDDSGYFRLNSFPLPISADKDFSIYFKAPRPDTGNLALITSLDKRKPALIPSPDTQYYLHKTDTVVAKHNRHVELDTVLTPTRQLRFVGRVTDSAGVPVVQANLMLFAGNVPPEELRYEMHQDMRGGSFLLDNRSHVALCRTVTDEKGLYSFCVVEETGQSLSIGHFIKGIDPAVFSIAVESLNGMTRLLHDITLAQSDSPKTVNISLVD